MADVFIGLGSNIGDRRNYLEQAARKLAQIPTSRLLACSSLFRSPALTQDGGYQEPYLNAVVHLSTGLLPEKLHQELRLIENALGRTRHAPWAPRTIDLDLLSYDALCLQSTHLTLPHPDIAKRTFVLQPLTEIAPHWRHPILQKTAAELLQDLALSQHM